MDWIGTIPTTWQLKALKHLLQGDNAGEVIDRTYWGGDLELLYTCALDPLACDFPEFPDWKRTRSSDLLLTRNGTPYVHKPVEDSIYTNVVQRITLKPNFNRDFLAIALQNAANNLRGYGVSIESLNFEMWKLLQCPLPSGSEQAAITAFLDHETATIDALVAEQERFITLLKEKRQAVISHAVTKGLDPNAPMKDSGVEWLGQVPQGWRVLALKHLVSMKSGEQITAEQIEDAGEFPVFGGNGLRGYTSNFTHEGNFPLIGRQGALCGNVNYAQGRFWASEHAVVVTPKQPCALIWLGELLRVMELGQYSVSAAQPGLSVDAIANLRIPVPSPNEQYAIATLLDRETSKVDTLTAESTRAIALLRERRAALISAAVTGKLDVRDFKPSTIGQCLHKTVSATTEVDNANL